MKKNSQGFSLIELLVVLTVFGIVIVVTSGSVLTTIRGAKRSDSDSKVRANVSFAMATMERHLRNAVTVSCGSGRVDFTDQSKIAASFLLQTSGSDRYVSSASASLTSRLTSPDVTITTLTFVCVPQTGASPASVNITIGAQDRNEVGAQRSQISTTTKVNLRTLY